MRFGEGGVEGGGLDLLRRRTGPLQSPASHCITLFLPSLLGDWLQLPELVLPCSSTQTPRGIQHMMIPNLAIILTGRMYLERSLKGSQPNID